MAEKFTEKRSGEERREAARRGMGPELSVEQVYDGESGEHGPPDPDQRFVERRHAIRREEDAELNTFLSDPNTGADSE